MNTDKQYFDNEVAAIRYLAGVGYEHLKAETWRNSNCTAKVFLGATSDDECAVYFYGDDD